MEVKFIELCKRRFVSEEIFYFSKEIMFILVDIVVFIYNFFF